MKQRIVFVSLALLLAICVVAPVVVEGNDCVDDCLSEFYRCEDEAYSQYFRCIDDDQVEESICNTILEIQLGVCERERDDCIDGCPS